MSEIHKTWLRGKLRNIGQKQNSFLYYINIRNSKHWGFGLWKLGTGATWRQIASIRWTNRTLCATTFINQDSSGENMKSIKLYENKNKQSTYQSLFLCNYFLVYLVKTLGIQTEWNSVIPKSVNMLQRKWKLIVIPSSCNVCPLVQRWENTQDLNPLKIYSYLYESFRLISFCDGRLLKLHFWCGAKKFSETLFHSDVDNTL